MPLPPPAPPETPTPPVTASLPRHAPSPSLPPVEGHRDPLGGEPLHIALVGMPGVGKTTVARLVAQGLGADFVDLDEVIAEAAGKPISAIFSEQGETIFRAHERRHVRALLRRENPMVLACGGGTWADAALRRELLAHTRPVVLQASFETLLERLEASKERHLRPLLSGPDPKAALERLWRARNDVHALCPREVSSMDRSPTEVAQEVVARLEAPADAERFARAQSDLQALSAAVSVAAGRREHAQHARAPERTGYVGGKMHRASSPAVPTPSPSKRDPRALRPDEPTQPSLGFLAPRQPELRREDAPAAPKEPALVKEEEAPVLPPLEPVVNDEPPQEAATFVDAMPRDVTPSEVEEEVVEAECVAEAPASSADPDDRHDDAFGTFLQQDIEAFAVPLATLSHEASPAAAPLSTATPDTQASTPKAEAMPSEGGLTPFLRVTGHLGDYPIYVLDADAHDESSEARAAEAVAEQIDAHTHGTRIAIVSDTEVAARHAPALREALRARGLAVSVHTFAAGEESKRLSTAHGLYDELADAGHGREDALVALGGGVVTDLTGFVASTYMRGVPLVQVPTSTLAAVDACIGGKTGLNTNRGKNLVGTFFAPQAVVISTAYLRTQSHRAHVAGLVEAAKIAALQDAALLYKMRDNARILAEGEPQALREVIGRALEHKARIVERDEQERGERALLNYGHTFGHAIEVGEGFGRLHGEAVALGMLAEAEWAEMHGQATNVSKPLAEVLEALGIPTEWRAARVDLDALGRDKKRMGDTLKLPVVSALGQAHLTAVALDDLIDFAEATMLPSVRWSR